MVNFRAMVGSTTLYILLAFYEVLVCTRIDSSAPRFPWTLVFIPLYFLAIISIPMCLWAVRNERSFEVHIRRRQCYIFSESVL